MARSNPPFMSGVPELLLLRQLQSQEMYGYELVRSIRAVTGEAISLGEGSFIRFCTLWKRAVRSGPGARKSPVAHGFITR